MTDAKRYRLLSDIIENTPSLRREREFLKDLPVHIPQQIGTCDYFLRDVEINENTFRYIPRIGSRKLMGLFIEYGVSNIYELRTFNFVTDMSTPMYAEVNLCKVLRADKFARRFIAVRFIGISNPVYLYSEHRERNKAVRNRLTNCESWTAVNIYKILIEADF